jgi:phage/plasmid primase-like uncharacterized protein
MSWDDEDFEPPAVSTGLTNNWEGEDEDLDNVKDSWDAPSDDDTKEAKETVTLVEKRKPKAERVAERKAQRRLQEQAEAEHKKEAEQQLTEEEKFAEKQRLQKLVEESDLKVAQDLFGKCSFLYCYNHCGKAKYIQVEFWLQQALKKMHKVH